MAIVAWLAALSISVLTAQLSACRWISSSLLYLSPSFWILRERGLLLYAGLLRPSISHRACESSFWWLLLDPSEVHLRGSKSSFCSKVCRFEGRMQLKAGCCSNNYGGMLSPHGGSKNRHRHDTPCCIQLGVSSFSFLPTCCRNSQLFLISRMSNFFNSISSSWITLSLSIVVFFARRLSLNSWQSLNL